MSGRDDRICIIGAGPGGLSAAYFLKKRGYKNVTVLESTGRVGGKCLTLGYEGRWFDIGANYVTSDYTEVLRLAEEFDAALYTEAAMTVASFAPDGALSFTAPLSLLTAQASFVSVLRAALRYLWIRFRLRKIIDKPGFAGVSRRQDLCRSFAAWLADNHLAVLTPMFEIPITAMGYGALAEIPAPYALKYMSPKTFLDMIFFGLRLRPNWPKRFEDGFQRLWEKVAASLYVRLNVRIRSIERSSIIRVVTESGGRTEVMEFDSLIVSSVHDSRALTQFLQLSPDEIRLFDKVVVNPFAVTTYVVKHMQVPHRIIFVCPAPKFGVPCAMTQQFENNAYWQFYTCVGRNYQPQAADVLSAVKDTIALLGGSISDNDVHAVTLWDYFPHVDANAIADGFYDRLEAMQGERGTYYCGSLLAFELVEQVVRYSRHLVESRF
jgi:predicted NAD/FAD-binding protein